MSNTERLQGAQQYMMTVARQLLLIPQEDMDAVIAEVERMDAIMPFTDPTEWMRIAKNIPNHLRLYRAIAAARREIAAVLGEERQR